MTVRLKQEITVWDKCDYEVPNHIYLIEKRQLIGYIPVGTTKAQYFKQPKKQWATTRRKFRDITSKKELAMYEF